MTQPLMVFEDSSLSAPQFYNLSIQEPFLTLISGVHFIKDKMEEYKASPKGGGRL